MYKEIHEQYLYVDFFSTDLEAELSIFVWINCLKFYRIDFQLFWIWVSLLLKSWKWYGIPCNFRHYIKTFCHESLDGSPIVLTHISSHSFCISSQWACHSTFKYVASACCSSSPSPASPVLLGDFMYVIHRNDFIYIYMCSSSMSYLLTAACLWMYWH